MRIERQIEEYIGRHVKEMGGLWDKFVSPGNAGVPDRILLLPPRDGDQHGEAGPMIRFVELKDEDGALSPQQRSQIRRIRKRGFSVDVIFGMKQAMEYVDLLQAGDEKQDSEEAWV